MKYLFLTTTILLALITLSTSQGLVAQERKFTGEVASLTEKYADLDAYKGGIVFTGSSSIRLWKTLESDFPKAKIINTGFGGSQTDDLLHYLEELVINFEPKKIFIYVGENDIGASKPVRQVMNEYSLLIERVSKKHPETAFFFIGTKPSPSRWEKRVQMMALNEEVKRLAQNQDKVTYIDVWTPMINKTGTPKEELFVEDRLHMNAKGYKIWKKAVEPHLR
jgi:lysophospholipase L1-like esterase